MGTPASCAIAQTASRSLWLGECPFGWREGMIRPLQPISTASRAIAGAFGLAFLPLVWEHVDLAMRRRTYFEPATQTLLAWMRGDDMRARAHELGGYDLSRSAAVRLNR